MLNFNFEQEVRNRLQGNWETLAKTLSTADGNGTSNAIAQVIDPVVREYISANATFFGVVQKKMLNGTNTFIWLNEDSAPASYAVPDNGTITASDYGHSKSSVITSPVYNLGYISNVARRATASTFDLLSRRVVAGTKQFVKDLNAILINGDVSNNSTFIGLKAELLACATNTIAPSGSNLSHATLNKMLINQEANGYDTRNCVFLASANVYMAMKEAAFNNVRQFGVTGNATIGYAVNPMAGQLTYGGVPVLLEPALGGVSGTQNLLLVSIDENSLVVPMSHDITVNLNLPESVEKDGKPVRIEAELVLAYAQKKSGIIAPSIVVGSSFA